MNDFNILIKFLIFRLIGKCLVLRYLILNTDFYRVKEAILQDIWGDESDSFALFPDYITRFKAADPTNFAAIHESHGVFEAAFFAPGGLRKSGQFLRPFTAIDGTHTKSKYRMILLVACGIDANEHVIPLAWALVPIENHEWWGWFLIYLKYSYPVFEEDNHIFISDREKGIVTAVTEAFPTALHFHCCQHIADNLQQRYGNKVRPLFWIAARAKTSSAFTAAMDAIQKENNNAFLYLNDIDRKLWTRAYAPYPKWGHDTSNIIESLNSSWSDIRHLPPLQLIDAIYSTTMRMVYYRFKEPQKSALLANIPMAKFEARQTAARQFRVFESGNGIYQVEESDSGRRFIVNLTETKCSCKNFYEYQSPCSHAIAAARHEEVDPISLFFDRYTVKALRKTYRHPLVPISLEALIIDTTIQPPIIKKQVGRPRTKRIRKGSWNRKQTRCSTCMDWGHNKKGCRNQPVSSGRRQRARDWLGEVIVELGDLETESELENEEGYRSSDLSELNDSDIEEIDAEDRVDEIAEGRVTRSGRMI